MTGARAETRAGAAALLRLVPWTPTVLGAVYAAVFVARFPRLIEHVYSESDAAVATVVAQTAGSGGTIVLLRYGWFSSLWFLLLTRSLPWHRQLWEVAPSLFALGSVVLLAWASWRLAGRWAAAMTATLAFAASPMISFDRATVNYHTATWVSAVVLATFSLWLAGHRSRRRTLAVAALVTILAGTTLASDALFALVGIIPLACTGVLCLLLLRRRFEGLVLTGCAVLALPLAWLTTSAMTRAGVEVFPRASTQLAPLAEVWSSSKRLIGMIAMLAGGNYYGVGQLRATLSLTCGLLMLVGLAAPFALLRRRRRASAGATSDALTLYAGFWGSCLIANCAGYALNGDGFGYYLITVLYAVAACVPILLCTSTVSRLLASLAIAVVTTASLVNLLDPRTEFFSGPLPGFEAIVGRVESIAKTEHVTVGFADYIDASSLTWSTDMALHVAPVAPCVPGAAVLCPWPFNVSSSWYAPGATRSFVLGDSGGFLFHEKPPANLGRPSAVFKLDRDFTLYVYPYDVANRFNYSDAIWSRDGGGIRRHVRTSVPT